MQHRFILSLILGISLTVSSYTAAHAEEVPEDEQSTWDALPLTPLVTAPTANPRSPQMSIAMHTGNFSVDYTAALGMRIPLVGWQKGPWQLQLDLDGGGWFDLHRDQLLFELVSADYLFGMPVALRYGHWSMLLSYHHISAHLGDGLFNKRAPINYSREYVTALAAYDFSLSDFTTRAYINGGYNTRVRPSNLARFFAGVGGEARFPCLFARARPFVAVDLTFNQDTGTLDKSARLGFAWEKPILRSMDLSIALTAYSGSDRRGQFYRDKIQSLAVGLFIHPL